MWRAQLHLRRQREISDILGRHGLGYILGSLGLARFLPRRRRGPGGQSGHRRPTPPEHLRLAFEELGTTFIKLGQILSTRADLLPPAFLVELSKLQDAAPGVAAEEIRALVAAELGRPVEAAFASFDAEPLAAASIGQAHAATLSDGTEVVVKVRRPGVVERVEEDLALLRTLAVTASRHSALARQWDIVGLVEEFDQALRAELDYAREGRNVERVARAFAGHPGLHIPRIYWQTSTARLLTLDRIRGIKINDLAALDAAGIDRPALAQRAARILLKMVFEDGFFHADPHPGNFFVEPDGSIGLIDFGLVGAVNDRLRDGLTELLVAMSGRDTDRLVDALLELGVSSQHVNREAMRRDMDQLVDRYYGQPLSKIALGPLLDAAFTIARHHRLRFPQDLALLIKTAGMCEGIGAQLDPTFRLTTVLSPYAETLALRRLSPDYWWPRVARAATDSARLGADLPRLLRRLAADLQRGGLEIGVRPSGYEPFLGDIERMINRLVLGVVASAFIVGIAVLLGAFHPVGWARWVAALLAVGFVAASALGGYLAWSIVRSERD